MNVQIRPARASDADAAIPLIYSSGPAAFDYVFSHKTTVNARAYLHRAFQRPKGQFGHSRHVIAECDGEVVGAGIAFSGEDVLPFMVSALTSILGAYGPIGALAVMRRGMQVETVVQPPKGPMHYIAHLGVSPDFRSRGVGTVLVTHFLEEGRRLGRKLATLDVSVENPRAQALYERLGFRVTHELTSRFSNETATVPSHRRMERPL